jgi:tetratricopeptide (TPR) repeat protein
VNAPRPTRGAHALGLAALLAYALALPAAADGIGDGEKALKERRYPEAAEAFAKCLGQEKQRRAAVLGLGRAAARGRLAERLDEAEDAVTKLVKAKEDDAEARVALGEVYLAQALGKSDEKAKEFTFRDAQTQFEKALAVAPDDADAVAGLARTHWLMGSFDRSLEVVDAALARKPSAQAYFWQGQSYYEQARARYAAEPQAEATLALFRKARGAYEASVKLDPTSFDGWMQLAYASQYLGGEHVPAALEAYKKAAALDGESRFPLLGIDAVLNRDQAAYVAALEKLAAEQPANAAVHYFLGFAHLNAQRWDAAVKSLTTYTTKSRRPEQPAFLMLGRAHAKAGDEKEAVKAFEQALALNPRDVKSAEELDARLRAQHVRAAAESVSNAKACLADYERLTGLTQQNPFVPQNGAFILREAYGRHQGDAGWLPILKGCTALYERAAKVIADFDFEVLQAAAWGDRYGWAQITSDTGLMFQFYEPIFDAAQAEAYYLRALELSEDGYFDAWNNLNRLYQGQKEWQKAHDLCARAAEGLKTESGDPHTTGRAHARAEMERLVREGKVK